MDLKSKIMILIVLLLMIVIVFTGFSQFNNNDNEITVGHSKFYMPDSYKEGTPYEDNINITDGYNMIFLKEYEKGTDIKNLIKSYEDSRKGYNDTVLISNFTVGDVKVYKSSNVEWGSNHYWFKYGDYVYSIFNWEQNSKMNDIVKDLINSIH